MIVFHSDLDNTLIYSHKYDIGIQKQCVELYDGREVSYATPKTLKMLSIISQQTLFVPTTTRTVEQYRRIQLDNIVPKYVLACNGGVLLEDGKKDQAWYEESLRLIASAKSSFRIACSICERIRIFALRSVF